MRRASLLLLLAVASAQEPEGRRPIIPKDDPFPECGTGRVWTGPLRVRVTSGKGGPPVADVDVVLESGVSRRTDRDGVARFERADSTDKVRIRVPGHHAFEEDVPWADEDLLAELKPGVAIRGRVRLADGTPAKGARATCFDGYGIGEFDVPQVADEEGRFTILAVDRAAPFRLIVALDGFAPIQIRKVLLREEKELDLELGGHGGIDGVVTPPGEVWVRAAHRPNPLLLDRGETEEFVRAETAHARSDASGRYRIDGLDAPGVYVVCAGPRESALVELTPERPRAKVDISAAPGPPRTIRILDEHGNPLVEEWILLAGPTRRVSVQTSAEGTVDLPPGEWRVDVEGYLLAAAAPEVRLDTGLMLRGTVVEPDGKPAAGQRLLFAQVLPEGTYGRSFVDTDEQGRFSIQGLSEGVGWLTCGREPDGADDGRLRIGAGMSDVRVTLPAAASVAGRLAPAPTSVRVVSHAAVAARLGVDGSFRFDLRAGRAEHVQLSVDSGKTQVEFWCDALAAGATADLGVLGVDTATTLAGVVQDADGRPVEAAEVKVVLGEPYEPTWTDEKGAFAVPVRPVLPVVLQADAPGLAARYFPVAKPDEGPVKLVLDPGGLVRGRVIGAHGRRVPGAYIVFWRRLPSGQLSPLEDWKPETDSAGRFEIRLPPGTFHARYYDMGRSHARIPGPDVTVKGGETIDLEIRLP